MKNMKNSFQIFLIIFQILLDINLSNQTGNKIPEEIRGYHFHTYFFQQNNDSLREALLLRYSKISNYNVDC